MSNRSFSIAALILVASITSVLLISRRGNPEVVQTNLENIPMTIAGLRGTEDHFPEAVYTELNADKHVYRHYRSPEGTQVDLYIGYYGTAKGGRTGHNPYACLPGAGWGIIETRKTRLRTDYFPDGVLVNYILAQKGEMFETVLHWYQSSGTRVLATGIEQNLHRFLSRIKHNRNDGAFVRVSAFSTSDNLRSNQMLVKAFAEKILGLLPEYWPVER
jgi:EpsI family protein